MATGRHARPENSQDMRSSRDASNSREVRGTHGAHGAHSGSEPRGSKSHDVREPQTDQRQYSTHQRPTQRPLTQQRVSRQQIDAYSAQSTSNRVRRQSAKLQGMLPEIYNEQYVSGYAEDDQHNQLEAQESDQQTELQRLSRYSYEAPSKKHKHKVAIRVGIGAAALVVIVIGLLVGYMMHLDGAMSLGDRREAIEEVLEPAPFEKPFYVLLVGSDSREGAENSDADWAGVSADGSDQHADVIMLARVDAPASKVSLLSIPRDTPWTFDKDYLGKLNYTYTAGGIPYLVQAVHDLTGIPISHVVEIHMSGLIEMVDIIGGIEVNVPVRIDYHEALTSQNVVIEPGWQTLNGIETEVFARERLSLVDSDASRQSNVRMIVEAILNKIKSASVTELPGIVSAAAGCVNTDLSTFDLVQLLLMMGGNIAMYQGTVPSAGDINPNTTPPDQWICFEDPEGWERVLAVFKSGGDPSTVSYIGDETFVATPREDYLSAS